MKRTLACISLAVAMLSASPAATAATSAPTIGATAPDFTIRLANGTTGHLSDLKGSVVVLDFWASWCPWCIDELPIVNSIDQKYNDAIVIGINDEDASTMQKAAANMNLGFQTLTDSNDSVSNLYGVSAIPQTVVIDRTGRIAAVVSGYHPDGSLEQAVVRALLG